MIFVPRTFRMIRLGAVHMLLAAACCFTVFPFLWMAVSSLKTKAEVMAADAFLPSTPLSAVISRILSGFSFRISSMVGPRSP